MNMRSLVGAPCWVLSGFVGMSGALSFAQVAPEGPAKPAAEVATEKRSAKDEVVYTLDEFMVRTSDAERRINAEETLGALRVNTKLTETPLAVSVFNREFMEQFLLVRDDDLLAHVAGGGLLGEPQQGAGAGSRIRGYGMPFFRNGFSRIGNGEVVNMERVEIIKGPMSAMFGRANPGGIINYITQRPQRRPAYSFKTVIGSYNYRRAEFHATGPVGNATNVFYRLDASHTDQDGYQQFFYNRTWAASAALTYQHSKDTAVTLEFEQLTRVMNSGTSGIVKQYPTFVSPVTGQTVSNVLGGIATDLAKFNPFGPHFRVSREATTIDTRLEHRISDTWSLRANVQAWQRPFDAVRWSLPNYNVATGKFEGRVPFGQPENDYYLGGQVDLTAQFKTGNIPHRLLLTFDSFFLTELPNRLVTLPAAQIAAFPSSVRNLDPLNPDYTNFDDSQLSVVTLRNDLESRGRGVLVSDRVDLLNGRLVAFGSLRIERMHTNLVDYMVPRNSSGIIDTQPTYSVGGVYKVKGDQFVVFASTSSGFTAAGVAVDLGTGKLQENVLSEGIEVGAKGELLGGKLYWTASYFDILRKNIAQANPAFSMNADGSFTPGVPQFIGSGQEKTTGFEFEANGDLTSFLSFRAVYGDVDARIHKSRTDPLSVGQPLLFAPRRNADLSLIFKLPNRITVGGGVSYNDSYVARYGQAGSEITGTNVVTNQLRLRYGPANRIEEIRPEVTLFQAFANYGFRTGNLSHTVGFNVKNLADEEYYTLNGRRNNGREYFFNYGLKF